MSSYAHSFSRNHMMFDWMEHDPSAFSSGDVWLIGTVLFILLLLVTASALSALIAGLVATYQFGCRHGLKKMANRSNAGFLFLLLSCFMMIAYAMFQHAITFFLSATTALSLVVLGTQQLGTSLTHLTPPWRLALTTCLHFAIGAFLFIAIPACIIRLALL